MRVGLGASVHRLPTDGTKEDCRSQGECILGGLKEVFLRAAAGISGVLKS